MFFSYEKLIKSILADLFPPLETENSYKYYRLL